MRSNLHWVLVFFLALLLPIRGERALAESAFFGTALSISGESLVTRGILEFSPRVEERFLYDDSIETGAEGRMQLSFKASFLSVGPDTVLSICERKGDIGPITSILLERGAFRSRVLGMKPGEGYEIVAGDGRVEVSGTDFVAFCSGEGGGLSVTVLQGEVRLSQAAPEGAVRENAAKEGAGPAIPPQAILVGKLQSGGIGGPSGVTAVNKIGEDRASELRKSFPLPGDRDEQPVFKADLNKLDIVGLEKFMLGEKIQIETQRAAPPKELSSILAESVETISFESMDEVIKGEVKTMENNKFLIRFSLEVGVSEL